MKKIAIVLLIAALPFMGFAQFKSQTELPPMTQVIARPASSLMFGLFDPNRFQMHHNFSMSYMTMGGQGMMINAYTNTMSYQISDPLFLRVNLGVLNTPINSFQNPAQNNTKFFGGAELFYRPSKNSLIKFEMNVGPALYAPYGYYNYGFGNRW